MQTVNHLYTISLQHTGICHILAITDQQTLIIEEYYAGGFVAQHHINPPDHFITTTDENHGQSRLEPIPIPAGSALPAESSAFPSLEHRTGAPQRGIRAADRIDSLVYPLEMTDKMRFADHISLPVPPPMLIGLGESRVLSATCLPNGHHLVCRRLRLAYTLTSEKTLPDGTRINYDTVTVHQLQFLPADLALTPLTLAGLYTDDNHLHRPTQCVYQNHKLYIADSGDKQLNRVHMYHVQTDPEL